MSQASEFMDKLKSLLAEYNASIEADYADSSDTHGMHGESMVINVGRWNQPGRATIKVCDGWELTAKDLE